MLIIKAQDSDIREIAQLYTESFRRVYQDFVPSELLLKMDESGSQKKWQAYLDGAGQELTIARKNNKVLGIASYKPCHLNEGYLLLDSIHIAPEAQGMGVGKALIFAVGSYARKHGYQGITLCVVKGNETAEQIYAHLGAVFMREVVDLVAGVPVDFNMYAFKETNPLLTDGTGFAIYQTEIGLIRMEYDHNSLIRMDKVSEASLNNLPEAPLGTSLELSSETLSKNLSKKNTEASIDMGIKTSFTENLFAQLLEYFAGKRKEFDCTCMLLGGTDFQRKVWTALYTIPYGETRSYKDIALQVESPKAFRAVGMSNNKNPISILIPCHRVIGANGDLVGYGGGILMKKQLLKLELQEERASLLDLSF